MINSLAEKKLKDLYESYKLEIAINFLSDSAKNPERSCTILISKN